MWKLFSKLTDWGKLYVLIAAILITMSLTASGVRWYYKREIRLQEAAYNESKAKAEKQYLEDVLAEAKKAEAIKEEYSKTKEVLQEEVRALEEKGKKDAIELKTRLADLQRSNRLLRDPGASAKTCPDPTRGSTEIAGATDSESTNPAGGLSREATEFLWSYGASCEGMRRDLIRQYSYNQTVKTELDKLNKEIQPIITPSSAPSSHQ